MSVTQHALPPVSLSRDDKSVNIPKSSPSPYSPKPVDIHPIVSHQPSRDSPPPSGKPVSRPETPKPIEQPSRTSPPPEPEPEPQEKEEEEEEEDSAEDGNLIDMDIFQQILELDDSEDDHEFSRDMVLAFFSQASQTFGELDQAYAAKDLVQLSTLGHYLKGSSAALGVTRVQDACEKIQHYGQMLDADSSTHITTERALDLIKTTLAKAKKDYTAANKWLRKNYPYLDELQEDDEDS